LFSKIISHKRFPCCSQLYPFRIRKSLISNLLIDFEIIPKRINRFLRIFSTYTHYAAQVTLSIHVHNHKRRHCPGYRRMPSLFFLCQCLVMDLKCHRIFQYKNVRFIKNSLIGYSTFKFLYFAIYVIYYVKEYRDLS
jgi:hypothetical protein